MTNELALIGDLPKLRELLPGKYAFTMDPVIKKNRPLLAQACRGKPPSIKRAANTTIEVEHLVFYQFDRFNEKTGEVRRLPRLVVIARDGTMFSMSGWKAIEDALFPAAVLGLALPYNPPQKFKVSLTPCGEDGREYAGLEWIGGDK